jgi:F-type H+-transporting ATPase subunit b
MWNRVFTCLVALAIGLVMAAPLRASESAPAGEVDMNPFSLSAWKTDLALWTVVVFVCLLLILTKYAWGPLAAALDKRERSIADQIADAEAANLKAKEILADYQRKLAAAQEQVRAILDQGRRDAEKVGHDMLDKAKEDAAAEHARALKQIEAATAAAIEELADRSATLAVELAGKIVHASLNAGDHARLIHDAVAGFALSKGPASDASRN